MDNRDGLIKEILNLAKHITVEEARELIKAANDAGELRAGEKAHSVA